MGGNRIGLSTFAGPKKKYTQEELDEIFDPQDWKHELSYVHSDRDDTTYEQEYGSTFEEMVSSSDGFQSREEIVQDIMAIAGSESYDDLMKDEGLHDDESTSDGSSEGSSAIGIDLIAQNTKSCFCDGEDVASHLADLGQATGSSLDKLNDFLCEELEVDVLVQDMSRLREEVLTNGFENLNVISLLQYMVLGPKIQTIVSMESEDCKEEEEDDDDDEDDQAEPSMFGGEREHPALTSCFTDCSDPYVNHEEGMEIPYTSCSFEKEPARRRTRSKEKRKSLLAKVLARRQSSKIIPLPEPEALVGRELSKIEPLQEPEAPVRRNSSKSPRRDSSKPASREASTSPLRGQESFAERVSSKISPSPRPATLVERVSSKLSPLPRRDSSKPASREASTSPLRGQESVVERVSSKISPSPTRPATFVERVSSKLSPLSGPGAFVRSASKKLLRPGVLRLKLNDGSMATVSAETAAKLETCNWV
ncbi:expressed unknown protein [Seminavis robusta]|uniref:Uncharacterized protein n=1 Tax=Seminavis robusta TaxID=568900 RepID=A0A9N8H8C3_9STRA|nr:expressed unknown protein [Seminavis robusta]|eukprot:Sro156_g070640.1 n/a (479) ;mRNA; r:13301-14737